MPSKDQLGNYPHQASPSYKCCRNKCYKLVISTRDEGQSLSGTQYTCICDLKSQFVTSPSFSSSSLRLLKVISLLQRTAKRKPNLKAPRRRRVRNQKVGRMRTSLVTQMTFLETFQLLPNPRVLKPRRRKRRWNKAQQFLQPKPQREQPKRVCFCPVIWLHSTNPHHQNNEERVTGTCMECASTLKPAT